jgi:hypothetical protein
MAAKVAVLADLRPDWQLCLSQPDYGHIDGI